MKRLTLQYPKLCRAVLLLPVILPIIITAICFVIFQNPSIILFGLFCEVLGIFLFVRSLWTSFSMISIVTFCAKNNFEVRKGNKVYVQEFYKNFYHMTLSEFIRSNNELIEGHNELLESICDSMDYDSCCLGDEAVYYKDDSGRLLELSIEADEADQNHYHLDKDLFCWSYPTDLPQSKTQITKKQEKRILYQVETFLKSKSISFD